MLVALFVTSSQCAHVLAGGPYRGPGGQIEAVGVIIGSYMHTVAIVEQCAKHPQLKSRADRSLRDYLNKNQRSYMDVMRKMPALAKANGGDAEVQRLKAELERAFDYGKSMALQMARSAPMSPTDCANHLDRVDKGMVDLKVNNNNELTRILQ